VVIVVSLWHLLQAVPETTVPHGGDDVPWHVVLLQVEGAKMLLGANGDVLL
jgi:hypothetical protein